MSPASHLILVLGMHRSGTSLVARSLTCLGAELGPHAEWNGPDNPLGFAEDLDVLALDEEVLLFLNTAWHAISPIDWTGLGRDRGLAQLGSYATKLLRSRLAAHPLFALKEPRLCRLLPFWRPVFAAVGCRVSVVHVVRHPGAVARSLLRRNSLPIETGLALWLEYVRAAQHDADPAWPAVFVEYDNMVTLPRQQIARIAGALDIKQDMGAVTRFVQTYVRDDLWHEDGDDVPLPVEIALEWSGLERRAMM